MRERIEKHNKLKKIKRNLDLEEMQEGNDRLFRINYY